MHVIFLKWWNKWCYRQKFKGIKRHQNIDIQPQVSIWEVEPVWLHKNMFSTLECLSAVSSLLFPEWMMNEDGKLIAPSELSLANKNALRGSVRHFPESSLWRMFWLCKSHETFFFIKRSMRTMLSVVHLALTRNMYIRPCYFSEQNMNHVLGRRCEYPSFCSGLIFNSLTH